jgi:hypothetical protein
MQTSQRARFGVTLKYLWSVAVVALLLPAPVAQAQQLSKAAASLQLVPADALYYGAMLRGREQLDAVLQSKAWKKLMDLPAVEQGRQTLQTLWNFPFGPQAEIIRALNQQENRQLVELLGEMFSEEVFSYGGKNTADFFSLLGELYGSYQMAPLEGLLQGRGFDQRPDPIAQGRAVLEALSQNIDRLKAPDLVVGFLLKDTKTAQAQLKRLDQVVKGLLQLHPQHEGRWSKGKMFGGEFFTLKLDGSMVPWEKIPWERIEENQGQFDGLKKKLRDVKLTINIGLRDRFLIVSVGETPKLLEQLGGPGPRLAERQELQPLVKFADRRLTGINYESKEWRALGSGGQDFKEMIDTALDFLKKSDLTDEQKAKIKRDLEGLSKDLQKFVTEPGPALSFEFLTERGGESYSYDWSKEHGYDASKPLTILRHTGASPLLVIADRTVQDPESYQLGVKWLKVAWGYVEEFGISRLPEEQKEKYDGFMKGARPILGRLHKTTGEMLIPALADGQGALVLDAKMTSKQWHRDMPEAQKPLPMLELAIVLGVKDAELLKKAVKEYREAANELISLAGKFGPDGQAHFQIPPPQTKTVKGGTLYYYPIPEEIGLDKQISPAAGLSKNVAVLAISEAHATRLLQPTALKSDSKLLADAKRPLAAVVHTNCAGIIDALGLWVDYGLEQANVGQVGPFDVRDHVRTILDVLKVFRSYTSVTYTEGGALVTHGEAVFRDIE